VTDEVQLIVIGLITAIFLCACEERFRSPAARIVAGLSTIALAALVLNALKLSISGDPTDFLTADGGVLIAAAWAESHYRSRLT